MAPAPAARGCALAAGGVRVASAGSRSAVIVLLRAGCILAAVFPIAINSAHVTLLLLLGCGGVVSMSGQVLLVSCSLGWAFV